MRILIVEDEPKLARLLQGLIQEVRPAARVLGICRSIEETLQFLTTASHPPDLLFMDIELADGNSLAIFQQLTISAPVIFCTAYDEFMLEAFQANGIAYLLKPVEKADIQAAFAKLDTLTSALMPGLASLRHWLSHPPAVPRYNTSFLVRLREKLVPVGVGEIGLISLEHELVWLYTTTHERYPLDKTLEEVEAALDPAQFFRINRQMLVHRGAIVAVEPYYNRKLRLTLSCKLAEIPVVSRLKVSSFLAWLEGV